jgi:hypothetical protein
VTGVFTGVQPVFELFGLDLLQNGEPRRVYTSQSTMYATYDHSEYPLVYLLAMSSLFWTLGYVLGGARKPQNMECPWNGKSAILSRPRYMIVVPLSITLVPPIIA